MLFLKQILHPIHTAVKDLRSLLKKRLNGLLSSLFSCLYLYNWLYHLTMVYFIGCERGFILASD